MRATISALAHYVPPEVRDNRYFEALFDTTDAWIRERTGILERRVAPPGGVSDLIVPAALACIRDRGIGPEDVDCILVATITPDHVFPSTAAIVQHKLGARNAWGYDLSAACSGFVYGLVTASKLVESGMCRRVMVCGADKMTSITNYEDRATAVLFGDAAAVVLVEGTDDPEAGIRDQICRIDGAGTKHLYMPAGGSARPATAETVANREHALVQDGQAVFKAAVAGMADLTAEILRRNGLTTADLTWLVPHQANLRILQAVARRLGLAAEQVMINVDLYGNTSAASIPLCLSEGYRNHRLKPGDRVVLASFGAGFAMGCVYLRWGLPG